jgi:hypothetical protein
VKLPTLILATAFGDAGVTPSERRCPGQPAVGHHGGTLLVREAGGVVVDLDDRPHPTESSATIAVCPGLRADIMAILRESAAGAG